MEYVNEGEEALLTLVDVRSLLSASIKEFRMYTVNGELVVEVHFEFKGSSRNSLRLVFEDVLEVSFFYDSRYNFYEVENYKLFKNQDFYYLSLDPDVLEEIDFESISSGDQDCIKSRILKLYM